VRASALTPADEAAMLPEPVGAPPSGSLFD
jgi:hypothetical protein